MQAVILIKTHCLFLNTTRMLNCLFISQALGKISTDVRLTIQTQTQKKSYSMSRLEIYKAKLIEIGISYMIEGGP